jgi:hypothetical protein
MNLRASTRGESGPEGWYQKRLQLSAPSSISRSAPRSVRGGRGSAAHQGLPALFVLAALRAQALGHLGHVLRQHADQHLRIGAVTQDGFQVRRAGRFQLSPGVGRTRRAGCGGGGHGVVQLAHAGFVHRHQQLFLGREVVVQRARLHGRTHGDFAHRGARVATLGKAAGCGIQQAAQAVVGPGRVGWPRAGRGRSGRGGKAVHQDMEPLSERLFG